MNDPLALTNCAWCGKEPCACARCSDGCGRKLHSDHEREQGRALSCPGKSP